MKIILILFLSSLTLITKGQVIAVYCYDQNDSISHNVVNLITNGGFENTTCLSWPNAQIYCPNSSNYSCDIVDWLCTGGGTMTYAQVPDSNVIWTTIVEGSRAAYFGNHFSYACSPVNDDTSCINMSGCIVTGLPAGYPESQPGYGGSTGVSLEQTVNGLTIGESYVLEFWAGGESAGNFYESSIFAVDVGFGNILLREKGTSPGTIGTRFIIEFAAVASSHTIRFTNWGHICDECTELVIDDVRLYTYEYLSASVPHSILGINNPTINKSQVVFPNPCTDKIVVELKNGDVINSLRILTATGSLKMNIAGTTSLDVSMLAPGIYFVEADTPSQVYRSRVIKQ